MISENTKTKDKPHDFVTRGHFSHPWHQTAGHRIAEGLIHWRKAKISGEGSPRSQLCLSFLLEHKEHKASNKVKARHELPSEDRLHGWPLWPSMI